MDFVVGDVWITRGGKEATIIRVLTYPCIYPVQAQIGCHLYGFTAEGLWSMAYEDWKDLIKKKETEMTEKTIDFTKPVITRDGRPVRILCTDRKDPVKARSKPIIALMTDNQGTESIQTYRPDGRYYSDGGESGYDLLQAPNYQYVGWVPGGHVKLSPHLEPEWALQPYMVVTRYTIVDGQYTDPVIC